MCAVSNIGDGYRSTFPQRWPTIDPYIEYPATTPPEISKKDFDALKQEVEELKQLLLAAKRFDEMTGQVDCEMDEKVDLIRRVGGPRWHRRRRSVRVPILMETSLSVGRLRAALADLPDDLPIIMSSDEEGNDFNHLWNVEIDKAFVNDDDGVRPIHPDDLAYYEPEELIDVVVLWP